MLVRPWVKLFRPMLYSWIYLCFPLYSSFFSARPLFFCGGWNVASIWRILVISSPLTTPPCWNVHTLCFCPQQPIQLSVHSPITQSFFEWIMKLQKPIPEQMEKKLKVGCPEWMLAVSEPAGKVGMYSNSSIPCRQRPREGIGVCVHHKYSCWAEGCAVNFFKVHRFPPVNSTSLDKSGCDKKWNSTLTNWWHTQPRLDKLQERPPKIAFFSKIKDFCFFSKKFSADIIIVIFFPFFIMFILIL